MTSRVGDLIKSIRACKTASDERTIVSQECALIRTAFKDEDVSYRHRCLVKLLYINMLGYSTQFGQMECVKLIGSNHFYEKRIGYLGLTQLLDQNSEVLMLVTNSIKNDMHSKNQYIVGLALNALGSIVNMEMYRALHREVKLLLAHINPYIRKRAAFCAFRMYTQAEEELDFEWGSYIPSLFISRDHGVLLSGCTLLSNVILQEPKYAHDFGEYVGLMVGKLNELSRVISSPDYSVSDICDPFLHIRVLNLLLAFSQTIDDVKEKVTDILASIATNTTGGSTVAYSVLYECVRTILSINPAPELLLLGINVLGRFLQNKDINLRYVSLCLFQRVVKIDEKAVQRHRATIIECLMENDISIRRRALDVTSLLINEDNIKMMTKELLNCLLVSDADFKGDIVAKLCSALDRLSPNRRWHVEMLIKVMCLAGNYVQEEVRDTFVNLIITTPNLRTLAVFKLYFSVLENLSQEALVQTAIWSIGEFGDLLVTGSQIEGEVFEHVTTTQVLDFFEIAAKRTPSPAKVQGTNEFILTALAKLSIRFPNEYSRIKKLIRKYLSSISIEIQQRACEYEILLNESLGDMRRAIFDRIPITDNLVAYLQKRRAPKLEETALEEVKPTENASRNDPIDLLDFDDDDKTQKTSSASPMDDTASARMDGDILDDLFGKATPSDVPPAGISSSSPNVSTDNRVTELLDDMLGISIDISESREVHAEKDETKLPTLTVYDEGGINITFGFTRYKSKPAETEITATIINSSDLLIENFTMQVAMPPFVKLKMGSASDSTLEPFEASSITQKIKLENQQHGTKRARMRLRLNYEREGEPVEKVVDVSKLPAEL